MRRITFPIALSIALFSLVAFAVPASAQWLADSTDPLGGNAISIGAAVGDYNGNGFPDFVVFNVGGESSPLLENDGLGGFADATVAAFGGGLGQVGGASFADYDNDGDQDFINGAGPTTLFRNDGGVYVDVTPPDIQALVGTRRQMSWVDLNRDGLLDLYVCIAGGANVLYLNQGGDVFVNATPAALANTGNTINCAWGDYDNDGDQDAYIINAGEANVLLENGGFGTFTDVTPAALQIVNGPAGEFADFDNNGTLDLLVANGSDLRLFDGDGAGGFVDITPAALLNLSNLQGIAIFDSENDGDLDIYVGRISNPNQLLLGNGAGGFTNSTPTALATSVVSGGIAVLDADRNGSLDLYGTNQSGTNVLYRNNNPVGNVVRLNLQGIQSNRDGVGARIRVVSLAGEQRRDREGAWSSLAQDDPVVHIGLGGVAVADTVEITWPSGIVQTLNGVLAGPVVEVIEPAWEQLPGPDLGFLTSGSGVSFGDLAGDGYPDDFHIAAFSSQTFRNFGELTYTDVTSTATGGQTSASAWGDYDNDGDQDLILGDIPVRLVRNDAGSLVDVTSGDLLGDADPTPPSLPSSVNWVDANDDGLIDIYVTYDGAANRLYLNQGGDTFTQGTPPFLAVVASTAQAIWGDVDNDGDQDVYVVDSNAPSALYRNDGDLVFVDVTGGGIGVSGNGALLEDFDNDGNLDILTLTAPVDLYLGDGAGQFNFVSLEGALGLGGFAATPIDYDNDGDQDVYIGRDGGNHLYRNDGGANFTEVTESAITGGGAAAGMAAGYLDEDLRLDLFAASADNGPNGVFLNRGRAGNALRVVLRGSTTNLDGIGARIVAEGATSGTQRFDVQSGDVPGGSNPTMQHIGMGTDTQLDLTVFWPSGAVSNLVGAAGGYIQVFEPTALTIDSISESAAPNTGTLQIFVEGNGLTTVNSAQLLGPATIPGTIIPIASKTPGVLEGAAAEDVLLVEFDLDGAPPGAYDLDLASTSDNVSASEAIVVYAETVTLVRSTSDAAPDRFPSLAPPGGAPLDSMTFISGRSGGSDVFVKNPGIGDALLLTPKTTTFAAQFPDWSPDGTRIVFEDLTTARLYTMDAVLGEAGGTTQQLTGGPVPSQPAGSPSWSPDGSLIAYHRQIAPAQNAIFTILPGTDNFTQITTPGPGENDVSPDWSPDGRRLVFVRSTVAGPSIVTTSVDGEDAAGGLQVLIPADGTSYLAPKWSPDGKWIAYANDIGEQFDVFVMSARGPQYGLFQITNAPENDAEPSWNFDGTALAFVSNRSGGGDIYLALDLPMSTDTDGDGVPDEIDACPALAAGPGELDRDRDGCPDPGSSFRHVRYWGEDRFPLTYETTAEGDPDNAVDDFAELEAGIIAWNNMSAFEGADDGTRAGPDNVVLADGRNSISFVDPAGFLFGTIAITPAAVAEVDTCLDGVLYFRDEVVDTDMRFNTRDFDFATPGYNPGPQAFSLRAVATHEFGHFVGLSHSSLSTSTMFYVVPRGNSAETLEEDDTSLLARSYGTATESISGRVLRPDGTTNVVGAAVYTVNAADDTTRLTFSGTDGTYRFFDLNEDVRIFTQPLDGSGDVNGLYPGAVNSVLNGVIETNFLSEFWDEATENNNDFGAPGFLAPFPGTPITDADIVLNLDQDAPTVFSTDPDDGEFDVGVGKAISIQFNEEIDVAAFAANPDLSLEVQGGPGVAGTVGILGSGDLLVFTPTDPLQYGTDYVLTVGPNIQDVSGNPMTEAYVATFSTQAQPQLQLFSASPQQVSVGGTLLLFGQGFDTNPSGNQVDMPGSGSVLPDAAYIDRLVITVPIGTVSGDVVVTVNALSDTVAIEIVPPRDPPIGNFVDAATLGGDPQDLATSPDGAIAYVATDQGLSIVDALPTSTTFLDVTNLAVPGGLTGVVALPGGDALIAIGPTQPRMRYFDLALGIEVDNATLLAEPLAIALVPGGGGVLVSYADRIVQHQPALGTSFGNELREWTSPGFGFSGDVAVSPTTAEAYAVTNNGSVAVLGLAPGEGIVAELDSGADPQGVGPFVDGTAFLSVDSFGTVRRYSARGPLQNTLTVPGGFSNVLASPEGAFAYAANFTINQIEVLDLQGGMLTAAEFFGTGVDPRHLGTGGLGRYVYVTTGQNDLLEVYDTETGPSIVSISPTSGGVDTRITISGSGFDPVLANNEVLIGGVPHVPLAGDTERLVVQQTELTLSGAVQVDAGGAVSNTRNYKVVNRPDQGNFTSTFDLGTGTASQVNTVAESPDGRYLVVMNTDGSLTILGADPSLSDFLRPVQTVPNSTTGFSSSGEVVFHPDGDRFYAFEDNGTFVEVFDTNGPAGDPVQSLGQIVDISGDGSSPINPFEFEFHPDGSRLFVLGIPNGIHEVDTETDQVIGLLPQVPFSPGSMAMDRGRELLYVGVQGIDGPVVEVYDTDPASGTYRTLVDAIGAGSGGGPFRIVAHPDGNRLYLLTSTNLALDIQWNIDVVDIDPASPTFKQFLVTGPVFLNGNPPRLAFNPSGSRLFLKTETVPFGINAVDPFSLSTINGPVTAQFSVSRNFAISRDGARLYSLVAGDQIRLLDLSEANEVGQVSGFGQTGVAGQPLAQPLTIQLTGNSQELTEGGFVRFGTTLTGGDFGFGDQLDFGAADANGLVSTGYTTGLGGTGLDTINVVSAGGNFTAFLTVVPDTSQLSPTIVGAVPAVGTPVPGVNTVIAVDFTKAIVPATVTGTTFAVRRTTDGAPVAGIYTFANALRRVVFQPTLPLDGQTAYEYELTAGLADFDGNNLTNPTTFAFTTSAIPAPELHAVDPPSGKVGVPVILSGDGFATDLTANTVLFNGTAVTPSSGDPGALLVGVPFGATSGPVRVAVGPDTTNAVDFLVLTPLPVPVNEVTGTVSVPTSGQQIAVVPDGSRAYMTSAGANTIVPINIPLAESENPIAVGLNPFGITTSPNGDRIYNTNFFSNTVSVIDGDSTNSTFQSVIATIPVGLNPTGIASHPDGRTLYIVYNGEASLTIVDTDSTSAAQYSARSTAPINSKTQTVAVSPDGGSVLVGTNTGIQILDSVDGAAVASINTGGKTQTVLVTPDGASAVVLREDGVLILIDIFPGSPTEGQAVATANTGGKAQNISVSPDGGSVYVTNSDGFVQVYAIQVTGGNAASDDLVSPWQLVLVDTIQVGENPIGLAFSRDGTLVVVNSGDNTVTIINGTTERQVLEAWIDVTPNTLNTGSNGKFVNAWVELPVEYDPSEIVIGSVRINQTLEPIIDKSGELVDTNGNGILEMAFKFDRQAFFETIPQGQEVEVTVSGEVRDRFFEGTDIIRVLRPHVKKPNATIVVDPGMLTEITWDPIQTGPTDHVDILWSQDNGESWDTVAVDVPDTAGYAWNVPADAYTDEARVMVVEKEADGALVAYGVSEPFVIGAVTGIGERPLRFAMMPAAPNPFAARTNILFELPEPGSVTMRVYGVDGRLVSVIADARPYPAGRHALLWDGRNLSGRRVSSGVYFVRIQAGPNQAVQKLVRTQ